MSRCARGGRFGSPGATRCQIRRAGSGSSLAMPTAAKASRTKRLIPATLVDQSPNSGFSEGYSFAKVTDLGCEFGAVLAFAKIRRHKLCNWDATARDADGFAF